MSERAERTDGSIHGRVSEQVTPSVLTRSSGPRRWLVAAGTICMGVFLVPSKITGHRSIAWTNGSPATPLALSAPGRLADSAALFAAVDSYVVKEMRAIRAPGLALAIIHGDRIVHTRGFGMADRSGRPVTPSTPFILGSLSKSFTALAVMQLVDAGQVRLDAPVQAYLPWFQIRDRDASARVTVRHLLNHTSGLPKSAGLQLDLGAEASTHDDRARVLASVRLHHEPGAAFEYSNANYWLLGLVVEATAGVPYDEYVRHHIFGPLGMTRSFTSETEAQVNGLANGYRIWFGYPRPESLPYYARALSAGYLISTVDDMALYLRAHLTGGLDGGTQVVSPQGLAELHTPPPGSPYAMGWLADSVAGTPVLWHTGAVANYHGDALLIPATTPERRWGIVMLTNVNNFMLETPLSRALMGSAAILLGYEPEPIDSRRFRERYWLITALACAWAVWRLYQIATLRRWQERWTAPDGRPVDPWPSRAGMALLDPVLALGLFVSVPLFLESPISTLRWFVPDLADWLVLNTIVSLLIAGARLTFSLGAPTAPDHA